jgi:hypothetical protein
VFENDDPRRKAYLLRMQGHSTARIAEELRTTEQAVEEWIAEASSVVRDYMTTNADQLRAMYEAAKPRISPEMRVEDARTLLDLRSVWGPTVTVSLSGEQGWTHSVYFNDLAATTFGDLVEETLEVIRRDPQVTDAIHEDREVILVAAGDLSESILQERLEAWWTERLRGVVGDAQEPE